jgi:peroxiredoxin
MPAVARNFVNVLVFAVIVVMGGEIVYLVRQNQHLRSMLAEESPLQVLRQGHTLPPMSSADLDGNPMTVRYGQGEPSTVLIWFSPTCHLCANNVPFWNQLYGRYQASPSIRFLALSDTEPVETRAYVTEHDLMFPVVCVTDASVLQAYNGQVVPQTAILSSSGAIDRVWPGPLEAARQGEITAALDSLATNPSSSSKGGGAS